jgi:membrane associated rhomboid family serine protease
MSNKPTTAHIALLPLFTAVGTAVGAAIGTAVGDIPIGVAWGAGAGALIGGLALLLVAVRNRRAKGAV